MFLMAAISFFEKIRQDFKTSAQFLDSFTHLELITISAALNLKLVFATI